MQGIALGAWTQKILLRTYFNIGTNHIINRHKSNKLIDNYQGLNWEQLGVVED